MRLKGPVVSSELSLEQQSSMLAALAAAWLAEGGAVQRFETHISVVLVHGAWAYKFKKALQTAFLDQSTLARRQHACAEELRLNRRLAADLYVAVVPVTGTPVQPVLGGTGPVLDLAVKMQAFDGADLWDRLATQGQLGPAHVDELAALLARFHDTAARAAPAGRRGAPPQVRAMVRDNLDELAALCRGAGSRATLQALRRAEALAYTRLAPHLARRLAQGSVRECHGDLHLGNVVQRQGRVVVFDGIEFNDDWRWLDVADELAFMAMDLQAHGLAPLAHRFVNAYLQQRGDYDAVRLLPYYAAHRAAVRAKVALLQAAQADGGNTRQQRKARRYLALARAFGLPRRPALFITHGPSGSGKTTQTQSLLEAAGAVRIRADVERKRLAGLPALVHSASAPGAGLYSPAMTAATYARLLALAEPVLDAGCSVILDATFLHHEQRAAARRWAAERALPFVVLDFEADAPLLHQRLCERAARGGDASEADVQVLDEQLRTAEPLQPDEEPFVYAVPAALAPPWAPLLDRLRRGGFDLPRV